MIGRLLERLFVEVRADFSKLNGDLSTAVAQNKRATDTMTRQWNQAGQSIRYVNNRVLNLGYQLNDIGMTLATGMNPMTVMIQQGSQIAQIYGGQGGVRAMFSDLSRILVGIARNLWPLAALAGGIALVNQEIGETTQVAVTFQDTLLATFQVLGRYIGNVIAGPLSYLQEAFSEVFDFIAEWFPRVMNAVVGVTVATLSSIGAAWELLPELIKDALILVNNTFLDAMNSLIQAVVFTVRVIINEFNKLPDSMRVAITQGVNFVISGFEQMVNGAISSINSFTKAINELLNEFGADEALELFGIAGRLPTVSEVDLSSWRMSVTNSLKGEVKTLADIASETFNEDFVGGLGLTRGEPSGAFGELANRVRAAFGESLNVDYAGKFFEDVKNQAIENALSRIAGELDGGGGGKSGGGKGAKKGGIAGAAENALDSLVELFGTLDQELTTAADNLAQVFGSAFESIAQTGRLSFTDLIQDLNQLVISSTSQLLQEELSNVFKELAASKGGLGSLFSNLFSSLFGGGGTGFSIFGKAGGGIVPPHMPFMAHELGRENIEQDGIGGARRVTTAGRSRYLNNQSSSTSPVVNVTIMASDPSSFKGSQTQIAATMRRALSVGGRNE